MHAIFLLSALTAVALSSAQVIPPVSVNTPSSGATIPAGGTFTVEVQQGHASGEIDQVSLLIGIDNGFGTGVGAVLYNGPFTPAEDPSNPGAGLHQDFSVTLPSSVPVGDNVLTVLQIADFQAPGGSLVPFFDSVNVDIDITSD